MTVYTSERDRYLTQYTIIQNQLAKVGIKLDLVTVDHTTFHAKGKANENPLMAYGRLGPTASFLANFYLSSGAMGGDSPTYNYANYKNPEIDRMLEIVASLPVKAQEAIYAKIQRQLLVDLATYPTVHLKMPSVRAPYVDLGGQAEGTTTGSPIFTIKTRLCLIDRADRVTAGVESGCRFRPRPPDHRRDDRMKNAKGPVDVRAPDKRRVPEVP